MLETALAYASAGADVLPLHTPVGNACSCRRRDCAHPGKHPRTLRGHLEATDDVGAVETWWGMWPAANIGLRPPAGYVVVDVDPRHDGDRLLAELQDRHGPLPATRTARTGGNGEHRWYRFDGDPVGVLGRGLDVKSSAGFLVVPPSLHVSGSRYEWTDPGPVAPAPGWLAELLTRKPIPTREATGQITPARLAGLVRHVLTAPEGRRNRALYWAAARIHEYGADPAPLITAAERVGLSRDEAAKTVLSAAKAPARVGSARG